MVLPKKIKGLVNEIGLPASVVGNDGRLLLGNGAFGRCLGLDPAALAGHPLAGRVAESGDLAVFLAGGAGAAQSFTLRGGAGGRRMLLLRLLAEPWGTLIVACDAGGERPGAGEPPLEVARLRDMVSAASDWFFEIDRSMTRVHFARRDTLRGNVEFIEQTRRWPDEVFDVAYDPDGFTEVIRKMLAREPVRDYVHRQTRGDGRERYLRSSAVPFYGEDGVFQGYRGISIDVTPQVLAEKALRQSEARLRQSQQHLERAQRAARTGSAERVVGGGSQWSEGLYRLFGVDPASFSPSEEAVLALVHEQDRAQISAAMSLAAKGKKPPPGEVRVLRRDGEVRILSYESEVIDDQNGGPRRILTVCRDVTELRLAERRQQEMERQLLHSQKLEALGTLAGGIAHDLNNTLVPIVALTKVTAHHLPNQSRERDNLDTVLQASERARELVQQILAFSRNQSAERRVFSLSAALREALRMLRASLPATVEIREEIADVPEFFGDRGQLHQVIVNLVTNAAHAIGDAMGSVTVGLKALPGGRGLCLSVADTGCGMDEVTLSRIFEPFFTTKEVGRGTGLGLSVVHGIIASHGGRIEVSSKPGEGTRFTVYLPLTHQGPAQLPDRAGTKRQASLGSKG